MAQAPGVPPSVPSGRDDLTSADFPVLWPVLTRWADNDMFGHLNNAVYYQLFDTAINAWITTSTGVDPLNIPELGIVAESGCRYFSELAFPESLEVGLAVTRLGRSSVTYRLGVFKAAQRVDRARWGTGCMSTSTGTAAGRSRFPTPSAHCWRPPASIEARFVADMLCQCQF